MIEIPDLDIDVKDRERVAGLFKTATVASQFTPDKRNLTKHNNGVYFQRIPVDRATGLSAFPYDLAEELGYFKIDLLAVHVYDLIESQEELDMLLAQPVDWGWFQDERFFQKGLFHIAKHFDLCQEYPPRDLVDLAVLISVIRPSRRHLLNENLSWDEIRARVWQKDPSGKYGFKKSHAVGYAMVTTLHAKLIARHFENEEWED